MSPPWMPLYIADYLADTRRLSTIEHGAYLLLIMEYWRNAGLPNDEIQLARIAGLTYSQWRKHEPSIKPFFQEGWRHKRIDEELFEATATYERRSKAGQKGGIAKAMLRHGHSKANGEYVAKG